MDYSQFGRELQRSALYDYESKGLDRGDFASSDLSFVTKSSHVAYLGTTGDVFWGAAEKTLDGINRVAKYFVDFAGMNFIINEPISSSENTLGYPNLVYTPVGAAQGQVNYINSNTIDSVIEQMPPGIGFGPGLEATLNAINLHRNGAYGGANWKTL